MNQKPSECGTIWSSLRPLLFQRTKFRAIHRNTQEPWPQCSLLGSLWGIRMGCRTSNVVRLLLSQILNEQFQAVRFTWACSTERVCLLKYYQLRRGLIAEVVPPVRWPVIHLKIFCCEIGVQQIRRL